MKLYRVKTEASAPQLLTTGTFNHNRAASMQATSSSVQRGVTLPSGGSASAEQPVNHETREKSHIKQELSADGKSYVPSCVIATLNKYEQ